MWNIYGIYFSVLIAFWWSYTGQLTILTIILSENICTTRRQGIKNAVSLATLLLPQLIHNVVKQHNVK